MLDHEAFMHRCKTFQKVDSGACLGSKESKLQSAFVELVSSFLQGTCPSDCFRPLPPMLGNGHSVDLLKLYFVVKQKGGFDAISKNGSWDEVGLLYGLGPGLGSTIKLIYLKYLESLESWLLKLRKDKNLTGEWSTSRALSQAALMELGTDYESFLSKISEEMRKKDEIYILKVEKSDISFVDLTNGGNDGKFKRNKIEMSFTDIVDLTDKNDDNLRFKRKKTDPSSDSDVEITKENNDSVKYSKIMEDQEDGGSERMKNGMSFADTISVEVPDARSSIGSELADNVVKSSEDSDASDICSTKLEEGSTNGDSSVLKGEVSINERKQDSLSRMLCWMADVAKDPTDPVIGTIPECFSWELSGNDNYWKQVLLTRELLFLKRNQISCIDQSVWQRKQKMHPSMFDDQLESMERSRSSPRLLSADMLKAYVDSSSMSSAYETDVNRGRLRNRLDTRLDLRPSASIYTNRPQHRIPVGQPFQAEVPEWTGIPAGNDPKWLGTRVWPLEKRRQNSLIERDPIGKGRVDGCGCLSPGSTECVKFHVAERRKKMSIELGSAFNDWNFDKMGEECGVSWNADEEKKFKDVVKYPLALHRSFWSKISKVLPSKTWQDLVNYYFNVFVPRRRGTQNRHALSKIDSDDDETEYR